jgi:hypothetical protein
MDDEAGWSEPGSEGSDEEGNCSAFRIRISVPQFRIASKLNGSNAAMAPQLGHPSTGTFALYTSLKQVRHTNKSGSPCAHSTDQKD